MAFALTGLGFYPPEGFFNFHQQERLPTSGSLKEISFDSLKDRFLPSRNSLYLLDVVVGGFAFVSGLKSINTFSKINRKAFPLFKFSFDLSSQNLDRALLLGGGVLAWGSFLLCIYDNLFMRNAM